MARVLVVDDSPEIRETLRAVLERGGHEVEEASDFGSAIQKIETASYEAVIADGHFPLEAGGRPELLGPWLLHRASRYCHVMILHSADDIVGPIVFGEGTIVLPKCSSMAEIFKAVEGRS